MEFERIKISVRDTGVGIDAVKLRGLFSAFTKIMQSRELNREGVGLGLTISKNLAEAMGGGITVASKVGVGSEFTVVLPFILGKPSSSRETPFKRMGSKSERSLSPPWLQCSTLVRKCDAFFEADVQYRAKSNVLSKFSQRTPTFDQGEFDEFTHSRNSESCFPLTVYQQA